MATRSLPEDYDIAGPYAPATLARANLVLSAYESAHAAAVTATIRCADAASAARAPSQVLSLAAAVSTDPAAAIGGKNSHRLIGDAVSTEPPDFPGPLERSLHNLGVTDPEQLQRATELDRATEQLLTDTCLDLQIQARETSHEGAAAAATQYAITERRHTVVAARRRHQEHICTNNRNESPDVMAAGTVGLRIQIRCIGYRCTPEGVCDADLLAGGILHAGGRNISCR